MAAPYLGVQGEGPLDEPVERVGRAAARHRAAPRLLRLGQRWSQEQGKGQNLPDPGIPESFNVLVKELQALGIRVTLGSTDGDGFGGNGAGHSNGGEE